MYPHNQCIYTPQRKMHENKNFMKSKLEAKVLFYFLINQLNDLVQYPLVNGIYTK